MKLERGRHQITEGLAVTGLAISGERYWWSRLRYEIMEMERSRRTYDTFCTQNWQALKSDWMWRFRREELRLTSRFLA